VYAPNTYIFATAVEIVARLIYNVFQRKYANSRTVFKVLLILGGRGGCFPIRASISSDPDDNFAIKRRTLSGRKYICNETFRPETNVRRN